MSAQSTWQVKDMALRGRWCISQKVAANEHVSEKINRHFPDKERFIKQESRGWNGATPEKE